MALMAKARRVRRALEKAGWTLASIEGSHRKYRRAGGTAIFAFHDHEDLGGPAMARVAKHFGMTAHELRRLL
jgi:predicted RNA binding protein YcfA (HicA-like mRNA interferase family)